MDCSQIKTLHVARRFISKDLTELKTGYDLEHFTAISKLVKANTVIFQSNDGKYHSAKIQKLQYLLAPDLIRFFLAIKKMSKIHDLIIAQNPFVAGLFCVIIGKLVRKPVIVSVHGYEFTVGRLQSVMKGFVCKNATKIRVNSKIVKDTVMSWGVKEDKISIIEDRVDCKHFSPNIDGSEIRKNLNITDKMIISVGSLIEIKGFDTLLKSIKEVSNSFKHVKFVILGEGECKNQLERQSEELGIREQVVFLGNIPYEELPKYYAASDIFVHPSYVESMGRVILEAQASGKPVITTNVGGIPEAVTNKSAILVPPKNFKKLAEAIIQILKDREKGNSMGKNGREFVCEKFEFWNQEKRLLEFYKNTINEFYA